MERVPRPAVRRPRSTESALDWTLKLALYADQATKWGILRERLTFWNEIVNRLNAALEAANCGTVAIRLDFVELQQFLDARRRFFEIDTRFGRLGPKGVFHLLGAAGVLKHRVSGIGSGQCAPSVPPAAGRARIRGEAIRRLSAEPGAWQCNWQYIVNSTDGRMLDLSNPYATEEVWQQHTLDDQEAALRPERCRFLNYLETLGTAAKGVIYRYSRHLNKEDTDCG